MGQSALLNELSTDKWATRYSGDYNGKLQTRNHQCRTPEQVSSGFSKLCNQDVLGGLPHTLEYCRGQYLVANISVLQVFGAFAVYLCVNVFSNNMYYSITTNSRTLALHTKNWEMVIDSSKKIILIRFITTKTAIFYRLMEQTLMILLYTCREYLQFMSDHNEVELRHSESRFTLMWLHFSRYKTRYYTSNEMFCFII